MKKTGMGLEQALKRLGTTNKVVRVGIIDSATYPDGESVAQVAFWNEYGATVRVPERTQTVYRSLNDKTGDFNKNGRFVKRDKSNFASTHTVPAHTITIPPRPFFRQTIRDNKAGWSLSTAALLKQHDTDKALNLLGSHIKDQLVQTITVWSDPPNAPSTVAKKGFNKPLTDTKQLARTINYEVSSDES